MGKGTIVDRLVAADPLLWLSRSWTTRPRRPGEAESAYTFVDRPTFETAAREGKFLEWAEVVPGQLSGTPIPHPPEGRDILLEINVDGARQVKSLYPDAVIILVVAPAADVLAERMRRRGDTEEQVARRLRLSAEEERIGRQMATHVVVNDDLDKAVAEVAGILSAHRGRPTQPPEGA